MTQTTPPAPDAWSAATMDEIVAEEQAEQAQIDAALLGGATLLVNYPHLQTPRIHRVTCHTVRHQIDRCRQWEEFLWTLPAERLSSYLPSSWPRMPTLGGPELLVAGKRYHLCGVCKPVTGGYVIPPLWKRPVRAAMLRGIHVGRVVTLADGREVGELISVTIRHAAEGMTVTIRTSGGNFDVDPDAYVSAQLPAPGPGGEDRDA